MPEKNEKEAEIRPTKTQRDDPFLFPQLTTKMASSRSNLSRVLLQENKTMTSSQEGQLLAVYGESSVSSARLRLSASCFLKSGQFTKSSCSIP